MLNTTDCLQMATNIRSVIIRKNEMTTLKYRIIKTSEQYKHYCSLLEDLLAGLPHSPETNDEIELLTVLIEKWDSEHSIYRDMDPVALLHFLMKQRQMKATDLVGLLGVSKGLISDILNYKKGMSKEIIRRLSSEFRVSQEAFNRPYKMKDAPRARQKEILRQHLTINSR
jgi:HTH-type transcriptional regulator / antitoxin HigA